MARIGLLGGSFNPAHGGHRHISLEAIRHLGLDQVWWLVSPGNPLKPQAGMAPLAARLASAKALARRAPICVTDIERRLGTRFTVDSIGALQKRYPHHEFIWLMGTDNLAQFHQWKDWRGIARRLPIAVFARPHYIGASLMAPAMAFLRRFRKASAQARQWNRWARPALVLINSAPDPRSATALRADRPDWAQQWLQPKEG